MVPFHRVPDGELQVPKGYILLERTRDYVLCFCPSYKRDRYAVWAIAQDGVLVCGEYFPGPRAAVEHYYRRGRAR